MDRYFKRMKKRDVATPDQPCRARSGREGDQIVLRCVRGELARYRVTPGGDLRYVCSRSKVDA